jgi:hypothetical protein
MKVLEGWIIEALSVSIGLFWRFQKQRQKGSRGSQGGRRDGRSIDQCLHSFPPVHLFHRGE